MYDTNYVVAANVALYILKDRDQAQDVVQEVFLKLWERRDRLPDVKSIKSYIAQMARNAALDLVKGANKYQEEEVLELEYRDPRSEDEETQDLKNRIQKAVSRLSPKCRLVFSLSRFEGLTNDEIAEYLDISKRTVETQISQALKMFRTDLKHLFVDYRVTWPLLFLLNLFY